MSFTATIENGAIIIPEGLNLPDGTVVRVEPAGVSKPANGAETPKPEPGSFGEYFAEFIGMADDLPSDLAAQVDHYVHGQPKRS